MVTWFLVHSRFWPDSRAGQPNQLTQRIEQLVGYAPYGLLALALLAVSLIWRQKPSKQMPVA